MPDEQTTADTTEIAETLRRIDDAWLARTPRALVEFFDENIVMALPGFSGRVEGRDAIIAGFVDFCDNARVLRYERSEPQLDTVDDTCIATYTFEMEYEREGSRYLSSGRDLWVLRREKDGWKAVWRTMLDLMEEPVLNDAT
jgi:ketosteroid isomerase-like protein